MLSLRDQDGLRMLAGGNEGFQAVVRAVAERQRRSLELHARADAVLSGTPSLLPYEAPLLPVCVERASGSRFVDVDGNEYVDCHMAYTAGVLGHARAEVVEAVRAAAERGVEAGHFVRAQVELAERVQHLVPDVERVAFFHTGGEAVASAVRLARAATGRSRWAKFEGCYHGSNEVGLHNSWVILSGRVPQGPLDTIEPAAATAGMPTDPGVVVLPFNAPEALVRLRALAGELACVVVDPIPPFMSNWPDAARSFLTQLLDVAREVDVPVVFDEVVCGFRIAKGGAREWLGRAPQMSCFGKITSGLGIPLSIVAGEARFLDRASTAGLWRDYMPARSWLSSTLQANALAVSASLAQMDVVADEWERIASRLDRNHARLSEKLAAASARTGVALSVQGHPRLQMQLAIGKAEPAERTFRAMMAATSPSMMRTLLAATVYLRAEGLYTKIVPTLNLSAAHDDEDVDLVAEGIERAVTRMKSDGMLAA